MESLLEADAAAGAFLTDPLDAGDLAHALRETASGGATAREGDRVGVYRLDRLLGRGGMGSVYLAERDDGQFEQSVAVKLLHAGLDDPGSIRRFQTERQVLAALTHPSIAQLLDGGVTDTGVPYLVMEYVEGVPIDEFCDKRTLPILERLRLFRSVCAAVQYAHQNLIVHRDLKPSNVLVRPDGVVKLLDFGIAKVLQPKLEEEVTLTGQQVMTPRYASPEQVRHQPISTASDVYSIGVMLYRLLTGRFPFDAETPGDLIHSICYVQPPLPSQIVTVVPGHSPHAVEGANQTNISERVSAESLAALRSTNSRGLARALSGDLDDILLKALRKEPSKRYASAEQLSEDLERHVRGRPVRARPDSVRYRSEKFIRRNVPTVALAAAAILALALGVFVNAAAIGVVSVLFAAVLAIAGTSTWLFLRSQRLQRESERQRATAEGIASLLTSAIGSISPESAMGRDVALLHEILDHTAQQLDVDLPDSNPAVASLHFAIGSAYHSISIYDKAAHHLETALTIRLGLRPEPPDLGETLRKLGQVEFDRGNHSRSETLIRDAIRAHERNHNTPPVLHACALSSLAEALDMLGNKEEAESQHRAALRMLREAGAGSSPQFVECLTEFGEFLTTHEHPDEARTVLEEAISGARASENPVLVVASLAQMAFLERWIGNGKQAEALFRESLDAAKSVLPSNHPRVVSSVHNLASLQENRGDFAGAEPLYLTVLESQKEVLGEDHLDVGTTLNNLAGLYRKWGRLAESELLYQRALEIYEATIPGHVWVGIAMGNLALVYEQMKRFEEGADLAGEAIEILEAHLPADHWRVGERRAVLGGCLLGLGRREEGRALLQEALSSLKAQFGAEHRTVVECQERLQAAQA